MSISGSGTPKKAAFLIMMAFFLKSIASSQTFPGKKFTAQVMEIESKIAQIASENKELVQLLKKTKREQTIWRTLPKAWAYWVSFFFYAFAFWECFAPPQAKG